MGVRMKYFNIFGIHRKIQFLWKKGGGVAKSQYIEGLPKKVKREAWTVYIFSGGGGAWQERGGGVSEGEGVDTPMYTMPIYLIYQHS